MNAVLEHSIAALEAERNRLDEAIRYLTQLQKDIEAHERTAWLDFAAIKRIEERAAAPRAKRGRKSMGPEERKQVSQRMKLYWQNRRHTRGAWMQ